MPRVLGGWAFSYGRGTPVREMEFEKRTTHGYRPQRRGRRGSSSCRSRTWDRQGRTFLVHLGDAEAVLCGGSDGQHALVFLQNNFHCRLCWELEEPKGSKGSAARRLSVSIVEAAVCCGDGNAEAVLCGSDGQHALVVNDGF